MLRSEDLETSDGEDIELDTELLGEGLASDAVPLLEDTVVSRHFPAINCRIIWVVRCMVTVFMLVMIILLLIFVK